jgi:putative ABC transport system permease protein
MTRIPLIYTIRSLFARRLTTALTITGIALVVFVISAALMLAYGLQQTLVATGYNDNAIFLRKGSDNELTSGITRDLVNVISALPYVARSGDGKPLVSPEVVVIINLLKYSTHDMGNVTVRGVTPEGIQLRPVVRVHEGRMFTFGSREVIVGHSINTRFVGTLVGQTVKFGGDQWTIVGTFDANGTGFDSEIWGDADQLMQAFNRQGAYSSVIARLADPSDFDKFIDAMKSEQRLETLKVERERDYYERQSHQMALLIEVLGWFVTFFFSIGAIVGAMVTMFAAVANRTTEIGTLRALGFQRRSILTAFLIEALLISFCGGLLGLFFASWLQFFTISTVNFQTFSELAFGFDLSPAIVAYSLLFALVLGTIGGFFPALRASRLDILTALRAA